MNLYVSASVISHVGQVRTNNEDNFYLQGHIREDVEQKEAHYTCDIPGNRFLAAVADGMGGEDSGELASLLAVRALEPCSFEQMGKTAQISITRANSHICNQIKKNGGRRMGSTLTALYIDDGRALCCNIGDSRCYLLRDEMLTLLSTDHNRAKRMVELGVLTPEQAARHPSRHELTQYLGILEKEMLIQPAFSEIIKLQPGDIFLLCSDGLTDMVSEKDIAVCLANGGTPEQQAAALLQMALAAGGRDNVTALVAKVCKDPHPLLRRIFPA